MPTLIGRTPIFDDSGGGLDGTGLDNAWKQEFYNQIDAALAAVQAAILAIPPSKVVFPAVMVPSADPNTLDDYEEGLWNPTDQSGAGLVFSSPSGSYTKLGRIVIATGDIIWPSTANGAGIVLGGLPYPSLAVPPYYGGWINYTTVNLPVILQQGIGSQTISAFVTSGAALTNVNMSGKVLRFTVIYPAA